MGYEGIDVRQSGDRVIVRALLLDASGVRITSGTATLRLFELQNDGSLKSYDFNDNTFKTTALTTATLNLTHRQGNNSTFNTGLWTAALTTVSGFVRGGVYIAQVDHASASPPVQAREFQYGHANVPAGATMAAELHLVKAEAVNKKTHDVATGVIVVKDDDGSTTLVTLTPSEAGGVVTLEPS